MFAQPANFVFRPMAGRRVMPDNVSTERLVFGVGEDRPTDYGFPTFFRRGNRAQNSQLAWSGKPVGIRMLVTSPMRYNTDVTVRRTVKDVRVPATKPLPSRGKAPGLPSGI